MPNHHFIAQLVAGGGPDPLAELESIVLQVGDAEAPLGWLATRKPGAQWQQSKNSDSVCIAFFDNRADGCIDGVVARIISRHGDMPQIPPLIELHEGHTGFQAWWQLQDPFRFRLPTLVALPGRSNNGKTASQTFIGSTTFAYWTFDDDGGGPLLDRVTKLLAPSPPLMKAGVACKEVKPPARSVALPCSVAKAEALPIRISNLYGVDFSGGQETAKGNPKIWIASWQVDQETVTLRCGTDEPPLRRSDLSGYVRERPGWWVLDFPFGVAKESAAAILDAPNLSWEDWLAWCAAGQDATERRDVARQSINAAEVPWSTRRHIDNQHGTTWFPLFEQLYRQTIYGAGQVLLPLSQMDRTEVSVLPWHELGGAPSVVVEGFPGMTIRRRLGLAGSGYKGSLNEHRLERQAILDALMREPYRLPIPEDVQQRAIADTEGDAVDALVLLVAAWVSQSLDSDSWRERRDDLDDDARLVEGWFP